MDTSIYMKKPYVQAMCIGATMWILQHTEIPDVWKMWIHSYIVIAMRVHQYIKKPYIQEMWIRAFIAMFPHFEEIPHK